MLIRALATRLPRTAQSHLLRSVPCRFNRYSAQSNSLDDSHFGTSTETSYSLPVVRHGLVTVDQGERIAVWKPNGQLHIVDGPSRFLVFGSKVQKLGNYVASPTEFIRILTKDGNREYRYGPCNLWADPLNHVEVKVLKALTINANEAMVIYQEKGGVVTRSVVKGPAVHMPRENEWIHHFSWHGRDPDAPPLINRKKPNMLQFMKLRTMPDQLYFDVEGVRTADDALLTVKLMVFFEIQNIEKMLDATHDPPSDMVNTLSADIIEQTANRSFEQFKENSDALNKLEAYPQLLKRMAEIGMGINKVVFRGYSASSKLQGMHDAAIETRTQLKLQQETEATSQQLADFKLTQEGQRAQKERKYEEEKVLHKIQLETQQRDAKLTAEKEVAAVRRDLTALEAESTREQKELSLKQEREHLEKLHSMGLELTPFFVAKEQQNVKVLKFEGQTMPQMHLHEKHL